MAKSIMDLYSKYSSMTTLGDDAEEEFITSGSVVFDQVISGGRGIPKGKFIQLTSESGAGKTHITLTIAKQFCARGQKVCYIDTEKGVNESQIDGLGLKQFFGKDFLLFPLSTYEEAEEVLDGVLEDETFGLVIIDSITDLIPQKVIDASVTSCEPGLQARACSTFMKKYRAKVSRSQSKPSFIMINQMRTKIAMGYGQQTTVGEAGGQAQKFDNDIRIMMKKKYKGDLEHTVDTLDGRTSVKYGQTNEIWAEKTRYTTPFIHGDITIIFGKGISNLAAYQKVLMAYKALKMSGAGFWEMRLPANLYGVSKDAPGDYEVDIKDRVVIKARGSEGVLNMIKDNAQQCKQFIEANGGFALVREGSVDDSDE